MPHLKFWVSHLRQTIQQRPWRSFDTAAVFSTSPAILFSGAHPQKLLTHFHPTASGVPVTIFYRAGWSLEVPETLRQVMGPIAEARKRFPLHRYVILAGNEREVEAVTALGVDARFFNENIFVNENLFPLAEDLPRRKFDAILDAQLAPYKRLELAAHVRKLAIISGRDPTRWSDQYSVQIGQVLGPATWINGFPGSDSHRVLNLKEVTEAYRNSRVGLALSAVEGGCKASIQYLMSGLPIVSTKCLGGRDEFFDPRDSLIVSDEPAAVANGVQHFLDHPPSAQDVRERVMRRVWTMRHAMSKFLHDECGLPACDDQEWWNQMFKAGGPTYQDFSQIAKTFRKMN